MSASERAAMVEAQIMARGVRDPRVLDAMRRIPREAFVPPDQTAEAHHDSPLAIGDGQTISQPYIVALMAEALALQPEDHVLEIGTGSGYAAAVLGLLAAQVYSIERIPRLAEIAQARLTALGSTNVHVALGDGTRGWADAAPFAGITVAAAAEGDPPPALLAQLAPGGRLVIPLGPTADQQILWRYVRGPGDRYTRTSLGSVRFVPLVG